MTRPTLPLLLASLCACAAPNALSDDEDVLPGPELGAWSASASDRALGDASTDDSGSGAGDTGVSGPGDTAEPPAEPALATLSVARVDASTIACDHRGITAPCGELGAGSAVWSDTVRVMRVTYVLQPDDSGAICIWDSAYTLEGVGPDAGTVVAGVTLADGTPVDGTETSSAFPAASR